MKATTRFVVRIVGLGAATATLAMVGAGIWFVLRHRTVTAASPQVAEREFAALRARFAGQSPLLDMERREPFSVAAPVLLQGRPPIRSFHTVVFDTRGSQRIVRIDVPYWFGRRFAGRDGQFTWLGQLTFLDDTEFDPEAIRLSVDRLERRGPGLVADYRHPSGGQFISWVE
jgi:hypothetical protein